MVDCFLNDKKPELTFEDGVAISCLMAACYQSAELGRAVVPDIEALRDFVPAVARGDWRP